MSARSMRRARARALAAGTAVTLTAIAPAAASADSVVTNTNNSGPGSLRQALSDSNSSSDVDTITFAPSVTGTITVDSELTVNYGTRIDGPGAGSLTVRAPSSRVVFFYGFQASTLEIEGITLTGMPPGAAPGAGIVANCVGAETNLVLTDAAIAGSTTTGNGGAIFSDGCDVVLASSTISGNAALGATGDGGGIFLTDSAGGGVANRLTITDSRVSGNFAGEDGAGIYVDEAPATVSIERSTIAGNQTAPGACACGGGLRLEEPGPVTFDSSTISGNTAGAGGGMLVNSDAPFTMRNSTVTGNSGQGGGLYFDNGSDGPFTVFNSTIAGNTAGDSEGGGIYTFGGSDEDLLLSSTIVANNTAAEDPDIHNALSGSADVLADHSLIGTSAGVLRFAESAPGTNVLNTGPIELGPLADNGGPTQTMLPALGGPAIDAGAANALTTDQRGLSRTVDQPFVSSFAGADPTDIGAVEVADSELSGPNLKAKKKQRQKGKKIKVVVRIGAAEAVTARGSGTIKLGKKKVALTKPSEELAGGETGKMTLKPKGRRAVRKVAGVLRRGKAARASVSVQFTDAAGNEADASARVKLVG